MEVKGDFKDKVYKLASSREIEVGEKRVKRKKGKKNN